MRGGSAAGTRVGGGVVRAPGCGPWHAGGEPHHRLLESEHADASRERPLAPASRLTSLEPRQNLPDNEQRQHDSHCSDNA